VTGEMISSAMAKATSWRMTMKSKSADMTMDIVCPGKMHTQSKSGGMMMEMIRIDNAMYTKSGSKWMKVPTAANQAPVCGGGLGAGATAHAATFDPNVKMAKGGTQTINGESCTVWEGSTTDAKGAKNTFSVCVGDDHLPR